MLNLIKKITWPTWELSKSRRFPSLSYSSSWVGSATCFLFFLTANTNEGVKHEAFSLTDFLEMFQEKNKIKSSPCSPFNIPEK